MSVLSYQQEIVVARLEKQHETVYELTQAIRRRASVVAAASTSIVALVTAAELFPTGSNQDSFGALLLSAVSGLSVLIYLILGFIWRGGSITLPGSTDPKRLYDRFISVEADLAYSNYLNDLCASTRKNVTENTRAGKYLDFLVYVFAAQLALLVFSIFFVST